MKDTQKNEVATTENKMPVNVGDFFSIKDNMEGVEARLPAIDIIHQAQMFAMPDGTKVPVLQCRIVDISRANAYWNESFEQSGGNTPPDCWSATEIKPDASVEKPCSMTCAKCPKNAFGSAGAGKACKNMKRVHVVLPGQSSLIPYRLTIPPSNIGQVDKYIVNLSAKGVPYQLVTTALSLSETKSKAGISYSLIDMEAVPGSEITDLDEIKRIKADITQLLPVMRGQSVEATEYAS